MHNTPAAPPSIYRYSERAFRKYEPYIKRAVEIFPDCLHVQLERSAPSTFYGRCRDAIRSVLHNQWETHVDVEKLRELLPHFHVQLHGDRKDEAYVTIGPRDRISRYIKVKESEIALPQAKTLTDNPYFTKTRPSDEELTAMLILANTDFFKGTMVLVDDVSTEQKAYIDAGMYLEKYPNVVFDVDPANPYRYSML